MKIFFNYVLITLVLAAAIFFGLQVTIQSSIVIGCSMEPSLEEGQRLIINKLSYKFDDPERGDVVVFHPPIKGQTDLIKRVIALPNDTVEIKDGIVYVNGSPLDEPYIASPPSYSFQREVPEDYYFVLGDNRNNSNDSHRGWLLPRDNIVGKAWLSIWPPDKWEVIPTYLTTPD